MKHGVIAVLARFFPASADLEEKRGFRASIVGRTMLGFPAQFLARKNVWSDFFWLISKKLW